MDWVKLRKKNKRENLESAKLKRRKKQTRGKRDRERTDRKTEKYYAFMTNNFALLKYFFHLG